MFLKPDSMRKRSLAVHGPLKNWGKGTNKAVGRGGGGRKSFCLNMWAPKMWEHLLQLEVGRRGRREVVPVTRPDGHTN